jgi:hypothetical protein
MDHLAFPNSTCRTPNRALPECCFELRKALPQHGEGWPSLFYPFKQRISIKTVIMPVIQYIIT